MSRNGRLQLAILFAILSAFYIYGAAISTDHAGLLTHIWSASIFAIMSGVFTYRAIKAR